jgi:hypothetical protein
MLISYHENENLTVNQRQTYLNKFTKSFFCKIFNNNDKKSGNPFYISKKSFREGVRTIYLLVHYAIGNFIK